MNTLQRAAIFSPDQKITALATAETSFAQLARRVGNWEYELVRLQLMAGTRPAEITIPDLPVRQLVDGLASVLADTFARSVMTARANVAAAKARHTGSALFAAVRNLDMPGEGAEFTPEAGLDWYRTYSLRIVGVEQADVLERAKLVLRNGIQQGLTQREMMQELESVFTGFSRRRLANIVRTESSKIYEQAHYQAWQGEDEIIGYEVFAIMDGRTSPICRARDGKRIPKDRVEGWWPPYHFQCRTTLAPIFAWESVEWSEMDGPKPTDGFGTTHMRIPTVDSREAQRIVRKVGT